MREQVADRDPVAVGELLDVPVDVVVETELAAVDEVEGQGTRERLGDAGDVECAIGRKRRAAVRVLAIDNDQGFAIADPHADDHAGHVVLERHPAISLVSRCGAGSSIRGGQRGRRRRRRWALPLGARSRGTVSGGRRARGDHDRDRSEPIRLKAIHAISPVPRARRRHRGCSSTTILSLGAIELGDAEISLPTGDARWTPVRC